MNNMESQMALITHRERGSEENGLKEVISVNKQEIPPVTPVATEATLWASGPPPAASSPLSALRAAPWMIQELPPGL